MAILAQEHPTFQSAMRIIASITKSNPAIVTTTFAHNYLTGEILRLNIPLGFGMQQADQLTGAITVTSPTTFTIDIDTTHFDPYVIPAPNPGHFYTPGQVTPVAEVNSLLRAATQNVLPFGVRT